MQASEAMENPDLNKMVKSMSESLGERLVSVVLYGSAARGDFQKSTSDFNLLVVLDELDPTVLATLSPIVSRWLKRGQPFPRFFSPALINDSADVFPIEFLDIQKHHVVLHGRDPLADVVIHRDHLRLQCERELREKMMRLREGFMETGGKSKLLKRLLTDSYTTFIAIFRGCLDLLGGEIPVHNQDVVTAFCQRADIDSGPFERVGRLKKGEEAGVRVEDLFSSYYEELTKAVQRVDRFRPGQEETTT
jgi:predicted nucleotidyltransferase